VKKYIAAMQESWAEGVATDHVHRPLPSGGVKKCGGGGEGKFQCLTIEHKQGGGRLVLRLRKRHPSKKEIDFRGKNSLREGASEKKRIINRVGGEKKPGTGEMKGCRGCGNKKGICGEGLDKGKNTGAKGNQSASTAENWQSDHR